MRQKAEAEVEKEEAQTQTVVAQRERDEATRAKTLAETQTLEAQRQKAEAEAQRDEAIQAKDKVERDMEAQTLEAQRQKAEAEAQRDDALQAKTDAEAEKEEAIQAKADVEADLEKALAEVEKQKKLLNELRKQQEETITQLTGAENQITLTLTRLEELEKKEQEVSEKLRKAQLQVVALRRRTEELEKQLELMTKQKEEIEQELKVRLEEDENVIKHGRPSPPPPPSPKHSPSRPPSPPGSPHSSPSPPNSPKSPTPPPDTPKLLFTDIDIQPKKEHRDVKEFLADVIRLGSDEHLKALLAQLRECKEPVSFRNLSNDARKRLLEPEFLPATFNAIVQDALAGDEVLYVKVAADGQWKTLAKRLTPEEFHNWTKRTFLDQGRFMVKASDGHHYALTDGDNIDTPPAFVFDKMQVIKASRPHKPGGNFSKYYYTGTDAHVKRVLREKCQIPDRPPTPEDEDLLCPCFIHAMLLNTHLTANQKDLLEQFLFSRIQTRYIHMRSLGGIAEELGVRVVVRDIDDNPVEAYTEHGYRKPYMGAKEGWSRHKQEGILFGNKPKGVASPLTHSNRVITFELCLWTDHFFPLEYRELVKEQLEAGHLRRLTVAETRHFSTKIPPREVWHASGYLPTYFKTPKQLLETVDPDVSLPSQGYKLFLEELGDLPVYAESGPVKKFFRQCIRGALFKTGKDKVVRGGVTLLDRNSNHPYAASQISLPLGLPKLFPSKSCPDVATLMTKPVFFVEADVEYWSDYESITPKGYKTPLKQHLFLDSITASMPCYKLLAVQGGYYYDQAAPTPLKRLMYDLYSKRPGNPDVKRIMNSMYGKLIEKPKETRVSGSKPGSSTELRTNPLIQGFEEKPDGNLLYHYFVDMDYTYNFTGIASLILSQQRKNLLDTLTFCRSNGIPVFYSAADSIAIPTSHKHLFPLGKELGQWKIEAESETAIFVRRGLYYCGPSKIITSMAYRPSVEEAEKVFMELAAASEEEVDKWVSLHRLMV